MVSSRRVVRMVSAGLLLWVSASQAQQTVDFGRREFERSCASCHGIDANGQGPMRHDLTRQPADLTTLTKRNGGVFPYLQLWETIDGRVAPLFSAHGAREMPVWGDVYLDDEQHTNGWLGRNRMAALLDYINRIQKP